MFDLKSRPLLQGELRLLVDPPWAATLAAGGVDGPGDPSETVAERLQLRV